MVESTTSSDLVGFLREKFAYSADAARELFSALTSVLGKALAAGKQITIPEFGRFYLLAADGEGISSTGSVDLGTELAGALPGTTPDPVGRVLEGLFGAIRERMLRGEVVAVPGFGTFALIWNPPSAGKAEAGRVSELRFRSDGSVVVSGVKRAVVFEPAEEFRRQLAEGEPASILLAMPQDDEFAATLKDYLKDAGWDTRIATNVYDALSVVEAGGAFMVVMDAGLEEAQQLCHSIKLRRETSMIPLIVIYPKVEMLMQPEEIAVIGDENIVEPFEIRALMDMVDSEIARAAEERLQLHQVAHLQLPTDDGAIDRFIDVFARLMSVSGLTEEHQVAFTSAFKEAMRNAADHGNKNKHDKKIEVHYVVNPEKIELTVRDFGQGFNHRRYVQRGRDGDVVSAAREWQTTGRLGGLGIMLMIRCTDDLEYNDVGNRVTLTCYLPGKDPKKRG